MTILCDKEIHSALLWNDRWNDFKVSPSPDEVQIQPASLDLRLSNEFLLPVNPLVEKSPVIDPKQDHVDKFFYSVQCHESPFKINPGEFALGSTIERVELSSWIVGKVDGRSSYGRLGIIVHSTAGFIDPGFKGTITLEFTNIGRHPVLLWPGERICQISFDRMAMPCARPYGSERGSKYQEQTEPTASRSHKDPEAR